MSNYPILSLADVAHVSAGNSAPQDTDAFLDGEIPFIRTSDVGRILQGEISDSRDRLSSVKANSFKIFPPETILIPKSGASTFLNHRVKTTVEAAISSHLAGIIAIPEKIRSNYLFHYLTLVDARDLAQDASYPSLNLTQIEGIQIPVPNLSEQDRILDLIDQSFEEVDQLQKGFSDSINLFAEFLSEAIHQKIFQPDFNRVEFSELATIDRSISRDRTIPYLGMEDLSSGQIYLDVVPGAKNVKSNTFAFDERHVLYGRLRPYLNKVLVPNFQGHCSTEIFPLRPIGSTDRKFLARLLSSRYMCDMINQTCTGTRMPRANMDDVMTLTVPAPSVSEQIVISRELDEIELEARSLFMTLQEKQERASELRESILLNLFGGRK